MMTPNTTQAAADRLRNADIDEHLVYAPTLETRLRWITTIARTLDALVDADPVPREALELLGTTLDEHTRAIYCALRELDSDEHEVLGIDCPSRYRQTPSPDGHTRQRVDQ